MFTLPNLPYDMGSLEPHMSTETLTLHHGKHHRAYMEFVNDVISKDASLASMKLEDLIRFSYTDTKLTSLFNNAAQFFNHNEFWPMLKKNENGTLPKNLESQITKDYGSIESFKESFIATGKTLFGSGWVWVVLNRGCIEIRQYKNAENPLVDRLPILLGCDVWEHSYYVDYRNRRVDYLKNFINHLVNWEYVDNKFMQAQGEGRKCCG